MQNTKGRRSRGPGRGRGRGRQAVSAAAQNAGPTQPHSPVPAVPVSAVTPGQPGINSGQQPTLLAVPPLTPLGPNGPEETRAVEQQSPAGNDHVHVAPKDESVIDPSLLLIDPSLRGLFQVGSESAATNDPNSSDLFALPPVHGLPTGQTPGDGCPSGYAPYDSSDLAHLVEGSHDEEPNFIICGVCHVNRAHHRRLDGTYLCVSCHYGSFVNDFQETKYCPHREHEVKRWEFVDQYGMEHDTCSTCRWTYGA